MKKSITVALALLLMVGMHPLQARKQWTVKQAKAWEKKVGAIKGFNQPEPTPGQTLEDLYVKAKEIGLNSVRAWVGGRTADEKIESIRKHVALAKKYGMTFSPVLTVPVSAEFIKSDGKDEKSIQSMKEYTQKMIGAFAKEETVVLWDLWNEPGCANFGLNKTNEQQFMMTLEAIGMIADWAYEMDPVQPMSSSIFWRGDLIENKTELHKKAREIEAKMDVHNFHNYACAGHADSQHDYITRELEYLKAISDRPMVCTECLTRVNNSGLSRTFATFQKYNVHFYLWGLYLCDANWTIRWGTSAYDPYDPVFHNLLRPDGEPIDYRDIDLIKDYKFTNGVSTDKGAEFTDKWESQRAWRWMATGPIKGKVAASVKEALGLLNGNMHGINSLNVKLSFADYKANSSEFFTMVEALLAMADKNGVTIMFTLLNDDEVMSASDEELAKYEMLVLRRFYCDARVQAWDLYYHPGEKITDKARLEKLVKLLFHNSRYEYPNQPVMATPLVKVKPFPANFNYHDAFLHGRRNGWNMMEGEGGATNELCALIWKLSDVIAFSSNQSAGQIGWIKSVAYRYGRPIFCTQWQPQDQANAAEILDNFSRSHVFFYLNGDTQVRDLFKFKFRLTGTAHQ